MVVMVLVCVQQQQHRKLLTALKLAAAAGGDHVMTYLCYPMRRLSFYLIVNFGFLSVA